MLTTRWQEYFPLYNRTSSTCIDKNLKSKNPNSCFTRVLHRVAATRTLLLEPGPSLAVVALAAGALAAGALAAGALAAAGTGRRAGSRGDGAGRPCAGRRGRTGRKRTACSRCACASA